VILFIYGINASDSIGSEISEFFSGQPTDRTMWLLIGGVVALIVGLFMSFVPTGRRIS
jgi:TRAP-type C4-dicarboxylate transport system permease large subunit